MVGKPEERGMSVMRPNLTFAQSGCSEADILRCGPQVRIMPPHYRILPPHRRWVARQ